MNTPRLVILGLTLLFAACASGSGGEGGSQSGQTVDIITAQQLSTIPGQTAHEAVRRFRARWLTRSLRVHVFLDGRQTGDGSVEILDRFRVETIREIRYLPATLAVEQFGPRYAGGVINVITR